MAHQKAEISFINVSASCHDGQTKSFQIHSHAMRAYRRRQRQEQQSHSPGSQIASKKQKRSRSYRKSHDHDCAKPTDSPSSTPSKDKKDAYIQLDFDSPKFMAAMLHLCGRYIRWLVPNSHITDLDYAKYITERPLPEPLVLAASYLIAARYLKATELEKPDEHMLEVKARVLSEAVARLHSEQKKLSNGTISALINLLHFELCEGSDEAIVHLQALHTLSNPTTGVPAFSGHTTSLEMADLLHAIMTGAPLQMAAKPGSNRFTKYHLSVLTEELNSVSGPVLPSQTSNIQALQQCGPVMSQAANLMAISLYQSNSNHLDRWFSTFNDTAERFERDTRAQALMYQNDTAKFMLAFWNTVMLLYNGIVRRIPLTHESHQAMAREIVECVMSIGNEFWLRLPYFRLFILFTGASTVLHQREKSFFEAHIVRAMHQLGSSEWNNVKDFTLKFMVNRRSTPAHSVIPT